MSPLFSPATLKTILNNAPLIIQGADKLIRMIRSNKGSPETQEDLPMTVEGLKQGLERLEQRLDADAQADIEQIKLIEELARQNEVMAESLKRSYIRLSIITIVSVAALLAAVVGLILVSGRS
jgi:hypothetical protein